MDITLRDGTQLRCEDRPFAQGGEAQVFRSVDRKQVIKLYHQPDPTRERSLEAITDRFRPAEDDSASDQQLCWPEAIVTKPKLGVVMPHAGDEQIKLARAITPRWLGLHPEDAGTFSGRIRAMRNVAGAVRRLHQAGLCHGDLSENNILLNPVTGRVSIIDCDGIVVPDLEEIGKPRVLGSRGVMAPEVVAGKELPSIRSERHTLATLIYQTLLLHHPLIGRQAHDPQNPDRDDMLRFGERALFVAHPEDDANRPDALPYPPSILGQRFGRLITAAFVAGLHTPSSRPTAAEWEFELSILMDSLLPCPNPTCPFRGFPAPDARRGEVLRCPWCRTVCRGKTRPRLAWLTPASSPGLYHADGSSLIVGSGTTLHAGQVAARPRPTTEAQVVIVAVVHEDAGGGRHRWVLENRSLPLLCAADPDRDWTPIGIGEGVELVHARKLRFGALGASRDAIVELIDAS